ncbi:MAG TPA: hypothetical protein VFS05_10000, partial [Gemmatimonadaceae bacterium]|nr:hypothetical protein [Gemmatimonadaceae bacterium]
MTPDIPDPGSPEPGAPAPDASQPVPPLVAVEVRAAPVAGFRARLEWRDREIWLRLPGGPRSYWQALQSAAAQLRNDSVVRWLYEHAPAPGAERA